MNSFGLKSARHWLTAFAAVNLLGRLSGMDALAARADADGATSYVRVSPRDPRYLELSDGSPYIPIGLSIDPAGERFQSRLIEHPRLRIYALEGQDTTLIWCRDKQNAWESELEQKHAPEELRELTVVLDGIAAGTKQAASIYDPWKRVWSGAKIVDGAVRLPDFKRSIVIRLRRRAAEDRILVYTRNGLTLAGRKGFVHDNIVSSVAAIRQLGRENGFAVDVSDEARVFTDENLKQYRALVFSNTNNEVLDTEAQKSALQRYIRGGGAFVGIHSACGSMRNWPWFWSMVGGTFARHPKLQPFTLRVLDRQHASTSFLGETWQWTDEFYYLKEMPAGLHVLLAGDLSTLDDPQKPKGEATRPLAWCHEFEGGRCWFTALGHKKEAYSDPIFQRHLLGGILWALGRAK